VAGINQHQAKTAESPSYCLADAKKEMGIVTVVSHMIFTDDVILW